MSVAELKKAINEKVENLSSQDDLDFVLDVLNKIDNEKDTTNIDVVFKKADERYGPVLKKLAE